MYIINLLARLLLVQSCLAQRWWGAAYNHNFDLDTQSYVTEPHFRASILNITYLISPTDPQISDGYIFLSPSSKYKQGDEGWGGYGPQIFDKAGELVWYGNDTADHRAKRFHACSFEERDVLNTHLCFHDGIHHPHAGHSPGVIRVLNASYVRATDDFEAANPGSLGPDAHEINTPASTRGKTLLHVIYQPTTLSWLTKKGRRHGWTFDCCFQEVDMQTREVLFRWCTLDAMPIVDGVELPDDKHYNREYAAGNGREKAPMDFWHMNGVDRNEESDYLVSIRHLGTVVKVAGLENPHGVTPGTILWALGGQHNSFTMDGFNFSKQHTARFVSTSKDTTTLTFLDNAKGGGQVSAEWSRGLYVEVNNSTMNARLIQGYDHPHHELTKSAGSMQLLPNNNAFVGWGETPYFSEYTNNGTLLYHAEYTGGSSSQAWKYPWTGAPLTKPKVVAYSLTCDESTPLVLYASWNGATAVKSWRFFYGNCKDSSECLTNNATVLKNGFETNHAFNKTYAKYARVDAIDANGAVLASSEPARVFIPKPEQRCDEWACQKPKHFEYSPEESYEGICLMRKAASRSPDMRDAITVSCAFLVVVLSVGVLVFRYQQDSDKTRTQPHDGKLSERQPLVFSDEKLDLEPEG